MGTSDYDSGYRDYKKTLYFEAKAVRRAVFWYRVRVWAFWVVVIAAPIALLALMAVMR